MVMLQAKLGRPGQLLGSGSMGRGGRMVSPGPVGPVGSIGSMGPMGPAYVQSLHESAAMKLLGTWEFRCDVVVIQYHSMGYIR